jgi:serine/threonine-protein kinase
MSLIGRSIGNYQIKAKLGEGGMGAVYLGEHPLIGKRVAIKVLLEELAAKEDIVQRFFNEAKAVNDIGHQNIVDIVDFGKIRLDQYGPETVYFVMEFLDGESLSSRIRRQGLTAAETLHVIGQCCSALTASHQKGIVHRDLKPENIFLCPRGSDPLFVKILDFGIAKLTGDGPTSSKTRTGLVIGTPAYMSPEQCEGKGLIDHRSDVYSLGVVMYELLTGRVPFPGEGFGEILIAQMTRQPTPPSQLNPSIRPEVEAIVLHALEKDKNRRFQSMAEFAQAVRDPAGHMQAYRPLPGYTPQNPANAAATMLNYDPEATVLGQPPLNAAPPPYPPDRGPVTTAMQRPTTLSGASGEVTHGGGGRRAGTIVAVAAVVLLLGGGGFAFWKLKGGGGSTTTPPNGEEPTTANTNPETSTPEVAPLAKDKEKDTAPTGDTAKDPEDDYVSIKITSDPPGAEVLRADTGLVEKDRTPLTLRVPRSETEFDVRVRLAGYKATTLRLSAAQDGARLATLEKDTPQVVPKPAEPTRATKPRGTRTKSGGGTSGSELKDDMTLLTPDFGGDSSSKKKGKGK